MVALLKMTRSRETKGAVREVVHVFRRETQCSSDKLSPFQRPRKLILASHTGASDSMEIFSSCHGLHMLGHGCFSCYVVRLCSYRISCLQVDQRGAYGFVVSATMDFVSTQKNLQPMHASQNCYPSSSLRISNREITTIGMFFQ